MTKEPMLARGYHITVTSWENDGDNYNTKTIVVPEREEVDILVSLFKLLGQETSNDKDFGNMYEPDKSERKAFAKAVLALPGMIDYLKKSFTWAEGLLEDSGYEDSILDAVLDILYDVGLTGSEYYYTRVCDKLTVFYVEQDVYAERVI
jgi:hypothetical protein